MESELDKIIFILEKIKNGYEITEEEKNYIKYILDKFAAGNEIIYINSYNAIDLLCAINDREYVINFLKREAEIKENGDTKKIPMTEYLGYGVVEILKSFKDKDYLKQLIIDPTIHFTDAHKGWIVKEIGDEKLIDEFLHDKSIESTQKDFLIDNICRNDVERLKKYLLDNSIDITPIRKTIFISETEDTDFIERFIRDKSLKLEGESRGYLIIHYYKNDKEKLRECLFDETIDLTIESKILLVAEINDEQLTEQLLKNQLFDLKSINKINLIKELYSKHYIDVQKLIEYIFDMSIELDEIDRADLIRTLNIYEQTEVKPSKRVQEILRNEKIEQAIGLECRIQLAKETNDFDYIREKIEETKTLRDKIYIVKKAEVEQITYEFIKKYAGEYVDFELLLLIRNIENTEHLREFKELVEKNDLTGEVTQYLVRKIDDEQLKEKWDEEHIEITSISELSVEELQKRENIKYVKLANSSVEEFYSREEYIEIRKKVERLLEDIPKAKKGDFSSELETFQKILKRLSYITYDYFAISEEGEKNAILYTTRGNLHGGLIEGKCVCLRICKSIGRMC